MKLIVIIGIMITAVVSKPAYTTTNSFYVPTDCRYQFINHTGCNTFPNNNYEMNVVCPTGSIQANQTYCCYKEPTSKNVTKDGITLQQKSCVAQISCFPEDTIVISENKGNITMAELKIGDQILTYSKEKGEHYSKVIGWLHRGEEQLGRYLMMVHQSGSHFNTSALHSLALENGTYAFAKYTKDQKLFRSKENIAKTMTVSKKGVYAPYTEAGNYFVVKSDGDKVLAHCTANIKNPQAYDFMFKFFGRLIPSGDYTHPVAALGSYPLVQWLGDLLGLSEHN